jgi:formylglycine-generating enzyme required for sulfatase activity
MAIITRRAFLESATGLLLGAATGPLAGTAFRRGVAGDEPPDFDAALIHAPDDPQRWPAFRTALARWREEARRRLKYDDSLYGSREFTWTQRCYACGFLMLCDEAFYDPCAGRYRVDGFLDEAEREFGGLDAIILWHAYPRIGLDDRNQFDFYRDSPGGFRGLRELNGRFHARGVRVFVDYNPWDVGTRREGKSDIEALGELLGATDADGVFLDTLDKAAEGLRRRLDQVRPGLALESEAALPLEHVCDHHLSWAQWLDDSTVPGILRNRWFERRHMLHQIARWDRDHTAELHTACLNGVGMLVWENVFGSWVGWSKRDKSILRALLPIQRRFAKLLTSEDWMPLYPTETANVYASQWRNGEGLRLWTLVNRSTELIEGILLKVPTEGRRFYDLIHGVTADARHTSGETLLAGRIPPRGIGAFVAGEECTLGEDFAGFLAEQAKTAQRADWDARFPARTAELRPPGSTRRVKRTELPDGMIAIPGAQLRMKTVFRVRECGFYEAQDDAFARARYPRLHHQRTVQRGVTLAPYAINETPVTNAQFAAFLTASGYRPRYTENFLRHWNGATTPPSDLAEHPVVYVDLDDARAYARWLGSRLPTEPEWQYAAQGSDGRAYPWGAEFSSGACNGGQAGGTTPVRTFPAGASPFGCLDMCGNVWEWTESERSDGRTRFAVLKGGSFYRATGSDWYMDGGPQGCEFAAKMLLFWPGLDRCATVGFRCALDLQA